MRAVQPFLNGHVRNGEDPRGENEVAEGCLVKKGSKQNAKHTTLSFVGG